MKLVKKEDGTIVQVQETITPISIESIDAKIKGLRSTIENLQEQLKELEINREHFEKLSK